MLAALFALFVVAPSSLPSVGRPYEGQYFNIITDPPDCIQVDFVPGPTCEIYLLGECGKSSITSKGMYVVESGASTYNVTQDSEKDHDDFISDIQKGCPSLGLLKDDLNTYQTDDNIETMIVQFQGKAANMSQGKCPPPNTAHI